MRKRGSTKVRYETRATIDRPISDVFARLADVDGYGTWMRRTGLFRRSGRTSDGPLGMGTAYFDATRMGTFRGEVTDYEPPTSTGNLLESAGARRLVPFSIFPIFSVSRPSVLAPAAILGPRSLVRRPLNWIPWGVCARAGQ